MIRWGIVGTGGISHQMTEAFTPVEGSTVVAVCSRALDAAGVFADAHSIPHRFDSFERMLEVVDAVYIATPHITHVDYASRAIAAGKHVLCEKPMAMNAADARELARRARDAGVFLMEGMWMKFSPLHRRLASLIEEGVIGEARSVRAAFGAAFPRDESSRWKPGGSTLLDQGIYPVTLAHSILGMPARVVASGSARADGVDLHTHFALEYPDGRFAHGAASQVDWLDPTAAIGGTEGWITIDRGFWFANRMTVHHPGERGQSDDEVLEFEREGYVPMLRAVTGSIAAGEVEHPLHTSAHVDAIYRIMDEIRGQLSVGA